MTRTESPDDRCDALLRRVAVGDRGAMKELFLIELGRLIAVARRIVRRRELAEEVVQDGFVAIWEKAGAYDPRAARHAPGRRASCATAP